MHAALRREPGPHRTAVDLVNGFGRWWATAHSWEYLEGRTATLTVGSASRTYALPADLARLDTLHEPGKTVVPVHLVSGWRDFERLRRGFSPGYVLEDGALTVLAGIVRHGVSAGPELELTHAPGAATWEIRYRAGWTPVSSEGEDVLPLPWYAEQAFLEGLVVYTLASERGAEDGSASVVSQRLDEFAKSSLMQRAMAQDGELSGNTRIGEGAIGARLRGDDAGFYGQGFGYGHDY